MIDIVEESLAGMAKRRVSQVVAQANRLDQIAVEPQGVTDIACDTRDQLHVQSAARQIVIATEAKDLRFSCIAGVCGQMQNLFGIAHKCRTHERAHICGSIEASNDLVVTTSIGINDT